MKKLVIGILAHVDAGKTTLSESLLYTSGNIRKLGRVDKGDAFLDTHAIEKQRGITVFSKQAALNLENTHVTLLDTPGHVDFSAEMERTLQVLDYAILVISGSDGIQGHTKTLWRLLEKYKIPVFLFVNKMDQKGTDKEALLAQLKQKLEEGCIDFSDDCSEAFYEDVAMSDEAVLESFLEKGTVPTDDMKKLILNRKIFPCFFGSALKLKGVDTLLRGIETYTYTPSYPKEFGAKIFKIGRDEQGNRLTYLKITGGSLKVKNVLSNKKNTENGQPESQVWEEKVNQIRIYSGLKYDVVTEAEAGCVCTVTGLTQTMPGQGLGIEAASVMPVLEPVLTYQIELPTGCEPAAILPKLRELEEEEPQLHIVWDETLQEIRAEIMGEVQIEILKTLISERFGVEVEFGTGSILYKETIEDAVEGVGHFEPLKHYAEVHLLLEPLESGSGLQFEMSCSEEVLDRNWQRLILKHLDEREHKGVLTGSPITDMKITVVAGRAHQKHTEGGDFRQATYRAVRQGLKQAKSILLEPYYQFRLEVPENMVGRAMTDIEKMQGSFELPYSDGELTVLVGMAPVLTMRDYQKEVIAYTKGNGRLFCTLKGYEPCHNAQESIDQIGYDSEKDTENPTGSIFCSHGAGFYVSWDKVKDYMHVESSFVSKKAELEDGVKKRSTKIAPSEEWMNVEEIDQILARTYQANKRDKDFPRSSFRDRKRQEDLLPKTRTWKKVEAKEKYLLVDGYNIIFAWEELKALAKENIDGARGQLMDILCNYQGIRKCNLIVVFDAYRVEGHVTKIIDYHNIHVVYTKEAETADQYIEKFAHQNGRKYDVTVATSDRLEQIIIRGQGCSLLSANDFLEEIKQTNDWMQERYRLEKKPEERNLLFDSLTEDTTKEVERFLRGKEED